MTDTPPARGWSKAARRLHAGRPARPAPATDPAPTLCDNCGTGTAKHRRTDSSGVTGRVCDQCQWEPREGLSFG